MMLTSKFRYWIFLVVILTIILIGVGILALIHTSDIINSTAPIFFRIFFPLWYLFFLSFIFLGELRTKCIKVKIYQDQITKSGFVGVGFKSVYNFSDLEGYQISFIASRSGTYEFLYLLKDDKKVVKISEYYHSNYKEMKDLLINRGIENLGIVKWGFLSEFKETFQF